MTAPASLQLGETTDPTKLVPGSRSTVDGNATALSDESARISRIFVDFAAVRTPGWTGGLGQPAWEANFEDEQAKWTAYTDLLDAASSALTTYAGALGAAQGKAQDAIDTYAAGEAATRQAVDDYNAAVAAYNDSICAPTVTQSPFGTVVPQVRPAPPGPFVDPGESLRQEAQEILDQARQDLEDAAQAAVRDLGGLEGSRTSGTSDWWGTEGKAEGPEFTWSGWDKVFGKDPSDGRDGRYSDKHDDDFKLTLGSAEGAAWIYRATGTWEDYLGPVKMNADGSFTLLGADGRAEATIDGDGVRINADGTVTIVGGEGNVHGEYGWAEGALKGEFLAGADGKGHLVVDSSGAHAGGELFAGGKISGTAEGDVGGVGGAVTAEGWAGAGLAGDLDFGFDDGALTIGGSGGIAWGLGGKVGGEITLDFPEMWETGGEIVDGIGSLLD